MIALDQPLAARIGLDWADAHHDVSLQETGSDTIERRRIRHTPEALVEWITELRLRSGNRPVGICVELSRGPLVHALLEHDFIVLFPVNPVTLKRFREAFAPTAIRVSTARPSPISPTAHAARAYTNGSWRLLSVAIAGVYKRQLAAVKRRDQGIDCARVCRWCGGRGQPDGGAAGHQHHAAGDP